LGVFTKEFIFATKGEIDILDITDYVISAVSESKLINGIATVFTTEENCALVIMEYEHGLMQDLKQSIGRIVPRGEGYVHDTIDDDAHSHLRSTLLGSTLTIPFVNGNLSLGAWQQVLFLELGKRPDTRKILVQVVGE
jgi:secondary thiamine-phosphate synthase enzyme